MQTHYKEAKNNSKETETNHKESTKTWMTVKGMWQANKR